MLGWIIVLGAGIVTGDMMNSVWALLIIVFLGLEDDINNWEKVLVNELKKLDKPKAKKAPVRKRKSKPKTKEQEQQTIDEPQLPQKRGQQKRNKRGLDYSDLD